MAQFGVGANRRKGAASFEELNKMAADRMEAEKRVGAAGGGLESMMGDLGDMDLGALMKDLDPNTLQDLVKEGMKDPQMQEMVSEINITPTRRLILFGILFVGSCSCLINDI